MASHFTTIASISCLTLFTVLVTASPMSSQSPAVVPAGPATRPPVQQRQMTSPSDLKAILQDHFSEPRHAVSNADYLSQARSYINQEMNAAMLKVHEQEFKSYLNYPLGVNTSVVGINIIGTMPGVHYGTKSDQIYVVGAHYDTRPETDGVDSNGSGVVALLQLAKRLRESVVNLGGCRLEHTIIFAAFDLQLKEHEQNIATTGSGAFVREYLGPKLLESENGNVNQFKGAIILDSILNWNDTRNSQVLPDGFSELFPAIYNAVVKNEYRADFMALVTEGRMNQDTAFADDLVAVWSKSDTSDVRIPSPIRKATINPDQATSQEATATMLQFLKQDHTSFWNYYPTPDRHIHLTAVLFTDTGIWRSKPRECRGNSLCNTDEFLTDEKMQFLQKTIDTLDAFFFRGTCKVVEGDNNAQISLTSGSHLIFSLVSVLLARWVFVQ